jgi:hypothetical protein
MAIGEKGVLILYQISLANWRRPSAQLAAELSLEAYHTGAYQQRICISA